MFILLETDHDDLIAFLEHLHQYVPSSVSTADDEKLYELLIGRDQLTTSMTRKLKAQRSNSTTIQTRLDGLEPVCEDWHTKLCLLTVIHFIIM